MFNNNKFLAIITARSGSKGLRDKNIKELNGKPLIAYTIEAAKKSGVFDDIIVSTDSEEYGNIAKIYGAEVPFLRPDSLASDTTSSADVIKHTILELEKIGLKYDYFMLLQPTSPLRNEKDILNATKLLFEKNANAIVSVCEADHSPILMNTLQESLSMDGFISQNGNKRRQDLPKYYRLNGAIYLCNTLYYLQYMDFYKEKSYAYIMDKLNSVDIDDYNDFLFAELLIKTEVNK
ncbi:MAG: acylneuraminate cytidylyltransferase [Anaerocolumna sp.]|jgi:CMP-N,N'-diacetyllegionaminic acid synthase|nr:acylneuraminate cytidylyltransferase [Anaerocolumna sp.]